MNISRVVVGLGNPGEEYAETRHNIGWRVAEGLAGRRQAGDWREGKFNAAIARADDLLLVKPLTYMNHSGQAVQQVLRFYKLPPTQLLVISDDVDLPFGELRYRPTGGSGGQRGLQNILKILATEQVPRLRVGIGRPDDARSVTDFVLGRFTPTEGERLAEVVAAAVAAAEEQLE